MTFQDYFSRQASDYARYRPAYPAALLTWLADQVMTRERAWDCATGNGQVAIALADYFSSVIATDGSPQQIQQAPPHSRVTYRVALAEASGLPAQSVDLVTVGQALHWFDRPRFYAEVRRVLRPGGRLAVWCYGLMQIHPAVDAVVRHFDEQVGPFWPPERAIVIDGYRSLAFPFREDAVPSFEMRTAWTLPQLLGYLFTWSATQNFMAARGYNPLVAWEEVFQAAWGSAATRSVVWPLFVRVGA